MPITETIEPDSDTDEVEVMEPNTLVPKTQEEIENEIAEIFNSSGEVKPEEEHEEAIPVQPIQPIETIDDDEDFKTVPINTEEINNQVSDDKTNVNVDTDSVVVNNQSNNADFFDDFFGDEDV